MKVFADTQKCCSSGMCAVRAPGVFDQRDSDGVVRVLQADPPVALHEATQDAVAGCPVQAIWIEEN
jgi:ferredoxin